MSEKDLLIKSKKLLKDCQEAFQNLDFQPHTVPSDYHFGFSGINMDLKLFNRNVLCGEAIHQIEKLLEEYDAS